MVIKKGQNKFQRLQGCPMNNGLLMVAFGNKFDKMTAYSIIHSRKYTDLPITVLTNIKNRCGLWKKIKNVNHVFINDATVNNRKYKTSMIDYSPYDKTIYIDADSVIQRKGIEKAFDKLNDNDIMLNVYGRWLLRIPLSYYRVAMGILNVKPPVYIYYGAFIGFSKTDNARLFFKNWKENWRKTGIRREMPALASTVKKMHGKIKLIKTNNTDNIFSWKINPRAIIQHEYGAAYWKRFFGKNRDILCR